ncbi:MAG: hypothetical protein AAF725_06535 [Acidobacteriota bacterium]
MANQDAAFVRREHFIFLTIGAMLLLNVPAMLFSWGWKSAAFNTGLVLSLYVLWALRHRDQVLLSWLTFGVAAGFIELIADSWLVHATGSLVYPADEPHLVDSPAYMPFAWTLIMTQMIGVAAWLRSKIPSLPLAALATASFSGINIPLYEHLAKGADWWFYQATPMIYSAPYYIILGEFLIGLPLVVFAQRMECGSKAKALAYGVLSGLSILAAYRLAWWLVGPCTGAVIQFTC